jgi:hypothetical protein
MLISCVMVGLLLRASAYGTQGAAMGAPQGGEA